MAKRLTTTGASRPKILQNNTKPAPEKYFGRNMVAAVLPLFIDIY